MTPTGGTERLVFDFVSGNLIPDRSYLTEVAPTRGVTSRRSRSRSSRDSSPSAASTSFTCGRSGCAGDLGSRQDLLTAIGAAMKPPPLGASETRVRGGEIGMANVELVLPPNTVTKADLDERFGDSTQLPTTGPGTPHILSYDVDMIGQPSRCTVFATFAETPAPAASAKSVTLRIDRARG